MFRVSVFGAWCVVLEGHEHCSREAGYRGARSKETRRRGDASQFQVWPIHEYSTSTHPLVRRPLHVFRCFVFGVRCFVFVFVFGVRYLVFGVRCFVVLVWDGKDPWWVRVAYGSSITTPLFLWSFPNLDVRL